jgi:hypothetical protein
MPRGKAKQDTETLAMALIGFEQKKEEIDEKIRQIKSLLAGSKPSASKKASASAAPKETPVKKRRTLSAAARKRIAIAQKRRWDEHRKSLAAQAKG